MKKVLFIILSLAFLTACERKIDEYAPSANGVDFSKFIALGNGMSAGFTDGALYASGQENSVANILAKQLQLIGSGTFKQPLMPTEDGVGFALTPNGLYYYTKRILKIVADKDCYGNPVGTVSLKPGFAVENPDQLMLQQQLFGPPVVTGPYTNLGVMGTPIQSFFYNRLADPTPDGHTFNPYFVRFATSINTTILADAMAQMPTFFLFWAGTDDFLLSALAGTDAALTPVDTFARYYQFAIGTLLPLGKTHTGVVATIPDIENIPFFTTISKKLPYNGIVLDSAQAAGLNTLYTMYGHSEIVWKAGQNSFVYAKTDGTWAQMGAQDLFLMTLPTDSIKCKGMGIADTTVHPIPKPYPIPGKYILDQAELANIAIHISGYNQVITQVASSLNLALVDINGIMKKLNSGLVFDGIKMNTTFVSGGIYSTDGLYLTPRGNAVLTNYFIQAINAKYGCKIPQVNVTDYPALTFP